MMQGYQIQNANSCRYGLMQSGLVCKTRGMQPAACHRRGNTDLYGRDVDNKHTNLTSSVIFA